MVSLKDVLRQTADALKPFYELHALGLYGVRGIGTLSPDILALCSDAYVTAQVALLPRENDSDDKVANKSDT